MKSFCFSSSLGHMQMPHITITIIIIIIIQQHAISHELHFHFHYYYIYSVCVCVCRTIATPTRKTLNRKPINRKVHKQMLILHICIVIRNACKAFNGQFHRIELFQTWSSRHKTIPFPPPAHPFDGKLSMEKI